MSRVTTFLAASIASGALALTAPALAASGNHNNAKAQPTAKSSAKKPGKTAKPHAGKPSDKKPASKPDAKPKQ
ncbi:MAG: hypothetical protein R3B07_20795 [Polyangiaceae bacterium]